MILPRGAGSNQPTLFDRLEREIDADNGGTNYNEAFTGVAKDNPGADARIFLTDGEHNEGRYVNGHRDGPPTYVIGLGIGAQGPGRRAARADRRGDRRPLLPGRDRPADPADDQPDRLAAELRPRARHRDRHPHRGGPDRVDRRRSTTKRTPTTSRSCGATRAMRSSRVACCSTRTATGSPRSAAAHCCARSRGPARTTRKGDLRARGHRRSTFFGLRVTGVKAARLRVRYRMTDVRGRGARVTAQLSESRRRR